MKSYVVRKLGLHKGAPQVYLDIDAMVGAGFAPGKTYARECQPDKKRIVLSLKPNADYVVSKKDRNGKILPVIDINSSVALKIFEGMEAVRIVVEESRITILPLASEVQRLERLGRTRDNLESGEIVTAGLSFGAGIMDYAAHEGLKQAGLAPRLAAAIEIDEGMINHAAEHNDVWDRDTVAVVAPMQELVQDDAAMQRLPKADVMVIGIPCSGASKAGKAKRRLDMMESHPQVGHLVVSALMLIQRIKPTCVVVECVTSYAETASAQLMRSHLRDCGYEVQETVLAGQDFGALENRTRWFLVAASAGIDVNLQGLEPIMKPVRTIAEVLEPIGPDAPDWRTFDYLKNKEVRDAEKGNSFAMQVVTPQSTSCPLMRRGYQKCGSTDPLLQHPTNPDLLRMFTPLEHARMKGVPEKMVGHRSKTDDHAMMGQGISVPSVTALFKRLGQSLCEWRDKASANAQQSLGYSLLRATG